MTAELAGSLVGRPFGKVFQLSRTSIAVDLHIGGRGFLYINIEAGAPRIYLIERRFRDLEKASGNPSPFALTLKKRVSNATVTAVEQLPAERAIRMRLAAVDELGRDNAYSLVVQLTGRSSNLFLLDDADAIIDSARQNAGDGQETGTLYSPPERPNGKGPDGRTQLPIDFDRGSISANLDSYYLEKAADEHFRSLTRNTKNKLERELAKRKQLAKNLHNDLQRHGDADKWKTMGDLLLANAAAAKRSDGKFTVVDYFDESMPEVEIEADENASLTETAEKLFRKYTKARNAKSKIAERLDALNSEIGSLNAEIDRLDEAIAAGDIDAVESFIGTDSQAPATERKTRQKPEAASGIRKYVSSDGFDILVGKKAKDNDQLTFRTAKSLDTWLHAADYPGSHVVIRNPNRKEIPQRTLFEAAELAAFYSQGKAQPKAAVHYTQKKFVNKPKGAAPGLVSLASFKTLLVEPRFPDISENDV